MAIENTAISPQLMYDLSLKKRRQQLQRESSLTNPSIEPSGYQDYMAMRGSLDAWRAAQKDFNVLADANRRTDIFAREMANRERITQKELQTARTQNMIKIAGGGKKLWDDSSTAQKTAVTKPPTDYGKPGTYNEFGELVETPTTTGAGMLSYPSTPQAAGTSSIPAIDYGSVAGDSNMALGASPSTMQVAGVPTATGGETAVTSTSSTAGTLTTTPGVSALEAEAAAGYGGPGMEGAAVTGGEAGATLGSVASGAMSLAGGAFLGATIGGLLTSSGNANAQKLGTVIGGALGGYAAGVLGGAALAMKLGIAMSALGPLGFVIGGVIGVVAASVSVVCSELYRQGYITKRQLQLCEVYRRNHVDDKLYDGYLVWGTRVVKLLEGSGWKKRAALRFSLHFVGAMIARVKGKRLTVRQALVGATAYCLSRACWVLVARRKTAMEAA